MELLSNEIVGKRPDDKTHGLPPDDCIGTILVCSSTRTKHGTFWKSTQLEQHHFNSPTERKEIMTRIHRRFCLTSNIMIIIRLNEREQ